MQTIFVVGVILTATAGMLVCLLAAYLVYKTRQIHETLYGTDRIVSKLSLELTQTLQNFQLLTYELGLEQPLPPLRGWAASPDVLLVVARHIRHARPEVIFECGSGSSTVVMAQAARRNGCGHVYSVDHDEAYAKESRALLARYGLGDWATIVHAPLRNTEIQGETWEWYDSDCLPGTPPIDLLFIDGPPAGPEKPLSRYPAGPLLFPRLSPRGVVFTDDTDRAGEAAVLERWIREFPGFSIHAHHCEKGCQELRPEGVRSVIGVAAGHRQAIGRP